MQFITTVKVSAAPHRGHAQYRQYSIARWPCCKRSQNRLTGYKKPYPWIPLKSRFLFCWQHLDPYLIYRQAYGNTGHRVFCSRTLHVPGRNQDDRGRDPCCGGGCTPLLLPTTLPANCLLHCKYALQTPCL